jgi:hypothetical protein
VTCTAITAVSTNAVLMTPIVNIPLYLLRIRFKWRFILPLSPSTFPKYSQPRSPVWLSAFRRGRTSLRLCKNSFEDGYGEEVVLPMCGCRIHKVCEEIGMCCVGHIVKHNLGGIEWDAVNDPLKFLRVSNVCGHAYMTAQPMDYVDGQFEQMKVLFARYPLVYHPVELCHSA